MDSHLDKKQVFDLSGQDMTRQFDEIVDIILSHRGRASRAVNNELLMTAWQVGGYVSAKLKSEEWGTKVVSQLFEYICAKRPDLKGYSRSSIYNMVMFYDEYSSEEFANTVRHFLNSEFVQPGTGQLMESNQPASKESSLIAQSKTAQIVQSATGQLPTLSAIAGQLGIFEPVGHQYI